MINILTELEVRELYGYSCFAIMHRCNDAIIFANSYTWKTAEEAQVVLDEWLNAPKQIAELQEKLSDLTFCNKKLGDLVDTMTDKLHRRNLQIAELKRELRKARETISDMLLKKIV